MPPIDSPRRLERLHAVSSRVRVTVRRRPGRSLAWIVLAVWLPVLPAAAEPGQAEFEKRIAPILRVYCWECHGSGGLAGQLDLRNRALILAGGKSGPAVVPGRASESLLYRKIVDGEMPPDKPIQENVVYAGLQPSAEQREQIRRWIDAGAPASYVDRPLDKREDPPLDPVDLEWWAFQPPRRPRVPQVQAAHRVRTPVDAFLLGALEAEQLNFAPDADRGTLVRRLYLDLTGLPPTPTEVARFLADSSPRAYPALVDRLLSSPAFGERWGRRWLDVAGYVDTFGADNDAATVNLLEGKWRYRDYVIDALNGDMPFDQFITEQLAGDELADWRNADSYTARTRRLLIATGFLRQAKDSSNSKELNTGEIRNQVLLDTVQIVSSSLLGVTLHCAQCHSHKFDPISQADYYRFAAIFAPALNRQNWKAPTNRFLWDVSSREREVIDQRNAAADRRIAELEARIETQRVAVRRGLQHDRLEEVPEPLRPDIIAALDVPADQRNEVQKYLVAKFGKRAVVSDEEIDAALDDALRDQFAELRRQIAAQQAGKGSYGRIQGLWEFAPPPRTHLFRRGDFEQPGPAVAPGVVRVLDDGTSRLEPRRDGPSSGLRLQLAQWLTRPSHPLTARVTVNRIWQHYFGRGIVATPANFGVSGMEPTHPELLDWLATELIRGQWGLKRLHRTIVLSTVYRQSARHGRRSDRADPWQVDPQNRLLWRMPLRRLESEAIRDRVLAVSGALTRDMGGPPVPLKPQPDGRVEVDAAGLARAGDQFRRSLYLVARRNYHLTQLNVFDQPTMAHNCTRRNPSAVVLQSLNMLNSRFMFEQSERLARRVERRTSPGRLDEPVGAAFQWALGRPPAADEREAAIDFLRQQQQRFAGAGESDAAARRKALSQLCQMLMNTNEFLYIP